MLKKILITLGVLIAGLWAVNTSAFTRPAEDAKTLILSHRGVHQTYDKTNLGIQDCTATRIYDPIHSLLENTIPSMQAAFDAGADVVEIDVHLTKDKRFAVFHDWNVGCRTEAIGKVETFTAADLKALDIGYGYTADGGETFPFRGQHIGQMPMLEEVFAAFPEERFLINLKANNAPEGEAFSELVLAHPNWADNISGFYGGPRTVAAAAERLPDHVGFSRSSTKACLKAYVFWGWSGHMPSACHSTQLLVPINYATFLWGWPHKFTGRMKAVGTTVFLAGPYDGRRSGAGGMNTAEWVEDISQGFDGYIWTDKVEEIAPTLKKRE